MQNHIATLGWKRLYHSPDLIPSDFHLCPALKKNLAGRRFGSNSEVKQAVKRVFHVQSPFFPGELFEAYQAPNYGRQRDLGLDQRSKYIIDADSEDKNKLKNAAPTPTSSEMRNIIKSMCSYLAAHSNGEMNNKMEDIK
ncbi:hypothetical protein TNCV_3100651 [Trichonephila clavipes]|nr:hypothetical protein TNCV_3100651 [Trichonephila clavipes]